MQRVKFSFIFGLFTVASPSHIVTFLAGIQVCDRATLEQKMKFARDNSLILLLISTTLMTILGIVMIHKVDENKLNRIIFSPTPGANYLDSNQKEREVERQPTGEINTRHDLAQGLKDEEKFVVIVLHTNGNYDEYIIPSSLAGDLRKYLKLTTRDKIVSGYPLKPLVSTPILSTPNILKLKSTHPYPLPGNDSNSQMTYP